MLMSGWWASCEQDKTNGTSLASLIQRQRPMHAAPSLAPTRAHGFYTDVRGPIPAGRKGRPRGIHQRRRRSEANAAAVLRREG